MVHVSKSDGDLTNASLPAPAWGHGLITKDAVIEFVPTALNYY